MIKRESSPATGGSGQVKAKTLRKSNHASGM
jgi:hypothetical protein